MARQVATAAINALRDSHYQLNSVSGLYERAVLMEGSRTNGQFPSNDFTSANYTKTACTITASATTGPDGVASSASKTVEDTTTTSHTVQKAGGFTATASTVQSASCYLKAAERTWAIVSTQDGAGTFANSYVNLSTGATGTVSGSHTIRVNTLANGWYRVEVSWNSNVGGGANRALFGGALADNTGSHLGDGASGIYVYGYQVEADSPFTSSYIPTTSGTVTRGADSFSVPFTTPPQAMTLYHKFVDRGTSATANARVMQVTSVGAAGNQNSLRIIGTGTQGQFNIIHDDGAAAVSSTGTGGGSFGDTYELLGQWYPDGSVQMSVSVNGAAATVGTRSAAKAFPASFGNGGSPLLWLASLTGTANGFAAYLVPYKVALGVKTLPEMQALRSN